MLSKSEIITKLQREKSQTNANITRVRTLEDWLSASGNELEFLRLFKENLPEGTKITDITIEDGVVKDISGVTPSTSMMLNNLRKVKGLDQLKLKGTISITDSGEMFHLEGPIIRKEQSK